MYSFLNLKRQEISEQTNLKAVFLKSEEFLNASDFISFGDPIIYFETKLSDDVNY